MAKLSGLLLIIAALTFTTNVKGEDACSLRTAGPITKDEIREASALIENLDTTEDTRRKLDALPDAGGLSLTARKSPGSYYYLNCSNCDGEVYVDLSPLRDARDIINDILRKRAGKMRCRLRAIGVGVERP